MSLKNIVKSLVLVMVTVGFIGVINSNSAKASANDFDDVYSVAKQQLGKPYGWGAVGPNTFDCSGFTKYVYKKSVSKTLPRTAQAQYNNGSKVSASNAKPGDLVYFGGSRSSIYHVGLYVGNGKMIDSQNRGVITEKVNSPWWNAVGYTRPVSNLN
ncbi:hydrolase [Lactobacillus sp. S2-2]|uniref:C40 family peptidase n=1 Tax=Lactobacillus sp. S2-2 TaxID=2692917 RepID=UPI001F31D940|nr:NlpC/P60 family protein [Lactobacillus sp. S2-2]MCF6514626.1 hydrolase [Lactobacillus sp. S2-2]